MLEQALVRDKQDPLAALRSLFALPPNTVYLDGNSLGVLPKAVLPAVQDLLAVQWGRDLIASWNSHDWIGLPRRVGEQIAPLIGAGSGQVLCADSISVNVFKLLASALALRPERSVILAVERDFPTDAYMAQGLSTLLGTPRCELRTVAFGDLEEALCEDVAVLMLTQVNYRTGELYDMAALTRAAHAAGALVLWDLAHSAGVLPMELDALQVDMAVGCGYKYLNGGPGAPAFVYLNQRHHSAAVQPLSGWLGHRRPFAFAGDYEPAEGVERFQAGTPSIISMHALHTALEAYEHTSVPALRAKSLTLSDYFLDCLDVSGLAAQLHCLTPRAHERRGSQISLQHEQAWGISQALIESGVIVDFRAPDVVRFGFAPLYNSFTDVAQAVASLAEVMGEQSYRDPRYAIRPTVT
ncbi:MAG: kynureninase [Halieaceae bacterium]|jgi:kynureninase